MHRLPFPEPAGVEDHLDALRLTRMQILEAVFRGKTGRTRAKQLLMELEETNEA